MTKTVLQKMCVAALVTAAAVLSFAVPVRASKEIVVEQNNAFHDIFTDLYGQREMEMEIRDAGERAVVAAKAQEIVDAANAVTEEEKLRALYIWVSENIYYDLVNMPTPDNLDTDIGPQNSYDVLDSRLAICYGYAQIMTDFSRSQGIRIFNVHGPHTADGRAWDTSFCVSSKTDREGHAWNVAYIDWNNDGVKEWGFLDATWDALGVCRLSGGKTVWDKRTGPVKMTYYNPTTGFFSDEHSTIAYHRTNYLLDKYITYWEAGDTWYNYKDGYIGFFINDTVTALNTYDGFKDMPVAGGETFWYYSDDGVTRRGFFTLEDGEVYYANVDGVLANGAYEIDGTSYTFDEKGKMLTGTAPSAPTSICIFDGNKEITNTTVNVIKRDDGTMQVQVYASPYGLGYESGLIWSSSNQNVASVANGIVIQAGFSGETTITARSQMDKNIAASFTLKVSAPPVRSEVYLPKNTMVAGESMDIKAHAYPGNADATYLAWEITPSGVLTRTEQSNGIYTLTATDTITEPVNVTIKAYPYGYQSIANPVTLTVYPASAGITQKKVTVKDPKNSSDVETFIVSNFVTYGEPIGNLPTNAYNVAFYDAGGTKIPGKVDWIDPTAILDAGTLEYDWKFTPEGAYADTHTPAYGWAKVRVVPADAEAQAKKHTVNVIENNSEEIVFLLDKLQVDKTDAAGLDYRFTVIDDLDHMLDISSTSTYIDKTTNTLHIKLNNSHQAGDTAHLKISVRSKSGNYRNTYGDIVIHSIAANQLETDGADSVILSKEAWLTTTNAAEATTVTVSANKAYSISSNADWLTYVQNGNSLTLYAKENASTQPRYASITVSAGTAVKNLMVTQAAWVEPDKISLSKGTWNTTNYLSDSTTVTVQANKAFTVTEKPDWLTISISENVITFTANDNMNAASRSASLTITAGTASAVFSVSQAGKPADYSVALSKTEWLLADYKQGILSVRVTLEGTKSFSYADGVDWITCVGAGSYIIVTVEENPTYEARTATLTVTARTAVATLKITQPGIPNPNSVSLTKETWDLSSHEANTTDITVTTASGTWGVESSDAWLTTAKSGNTLTFTAAENTDALPRTATVKVTSGTASKAITVTQAGKPLDKAIISSITSMAHQQGNVALEAMVHNNTEAAVSYTGVIALYDASHVLLSSEFKLLQLAKGERVHIPASFSNCANAAYAKIYVLDQQYTTVCEVAAQSMLP